MTDQHPDDGPDREGSFADRDVEDDEPGEEIQPEGEYKDKDQNLEGRLEGRDDETGITRPASPDPT